MQDRLKELIPIYAENKTEADSYKKICEKQNKEIKEIMLQNNLDFAESGDYVAKCTVSKRESMNEDILLEILKETGYTKNIIKTKEYVDIDVLEHAIYTGEIPIEIVAQLDKARETKEVITLKVTKKKNKENK